MRSTLAALLVPAVVALGGPHARADCGSGGVCALSFLDHLAVKPTEPGCLVDTGQPECATHRTRVIVDLAPIARIARGAISVGAQSQLGFARGRGFVAIELDGGAVAAGATPDRSNRLSQVGLVGGGARDVGSVRLSLEAAVGYRAWGHVGLRDHRDADTSDAVVEARAAAELWVGPHETVRVFAGSSLLHGDDVVGGIGVGLHGSRHGVRHRPPA